MPGGSLTSKPTWSNAFGRSATSAFFVLDAARGRNPQGRNPVKKLDPTMAAGRPDSQSHTNEALPC